LIQKQLEAHKLLDFEWVAHNRIRALSHGLDNSMLAVTTMRDHLVAHGHVDDEDFRVFAESLLARFQGLKSLMWVPQPGATRRTESSPVSHIAPDTAAGIQLGFDLASNPRFIETLSRASAQGQIAASSRIAYALPDGGTAYGFLVASPVIDKARPARGESPSRIKLDGLIVGFFSIDDLANNAISLLEPRGVEILILDESAPVTERFLHFYASRLSPKVVGADNFEEWLKDPGEPKFSETIQVADRQLTIVCGRTNLFRSAEAFQHGPWMVLAAGLVFTVLLSFYLARIRENNLERTAMELQLVEREELFRQMTETVDEAFWATAADSHELLYLSPTYGRILGVEHEVRLPSLLEAVHPDDRKALAEALGRTASDGGDVEVVHRIRRADGTLRWVRTRGFAVRDTYNQIYRVVGSVEDITERKLADEALRESEAKLRDMFQHSPDIIMTVDSRGKVLLMNRSIPALPAERALGRNALALMPRDLRKWFRKALKKAFRKGEARQFQYSADDGTYWEGRIVPIRDDGGQISAAMVIAADVTEKRNLEEQALHNARLASIGVLAAGVAHEINNPNNAIQFNASLVSRAWQDITPILHEYSEAHGDFALGGLSFSESCETYPRLLSEITRNSDRIRRIVENLKHMSRQDAGKLTEPVDIQQVLEATVMILHNQIQKFTDFFTLDVPDNLPTITGNSQQLEQVFVNVLLNALQALPDRTRKIQLGAVYDADDNMVLVTVRDEGRGIPERDLGRLTEPFFSTRKDSGGTGLGLSISRSIMEKLGGSLGFESKLGSGTTVIIRIPVTHPV
jgi:PAS domain S-box-containing protein